MGWAFVWLWVCITCSRLFLVGGQTSGCCAQCKSGSYYNNYVLTRLDCNIPSEPINPNLRNCADNCGNFCNGCASNYEENRNDCRGSCIKCPVGKINTGDPDTVCVACQPGYRVNGFVCTACTAGKYQDGYHQASCKDCGPGTFSSEFGEIRCWPVGECMAGEYATHTGSSTTYVECAQCSEGTITATNNVAGVCTACVTGKFQTRKGAAACLDHVECVVGERMVRVGTVTRQFECEMCVAPWTTVAGTQSLCNSCVAGKYFDIVTMGGIATNVCTSCQCNTAGMYINCPVGTTSSSTTRCMFCSGTQAGSYCPVGQEEGGCTGTQLGNVACKNCLAGYHKPISNSKNCVKCPTGTYKVAQGTASCGACTNGASNSNYGAWDLLDATSNECPW
jgi:hypothetical protein